MDAGLVCESIRAYNRFVGCQRCARNFDQQAARRIELVETYIGVHTESGLPYVQQYDDFFESGIPGALADAVDCQFELTRARLHRGQGIGDAQAKVIVAVRAQRDTVRAVQKFDHGPEHGGIFFRHRVTDRVRQINGRGAGPDGPADRFTQKMDIGTAGVFGGKFDFRAALARVTNIV